ncbi:MAG: hypothetical protein IJZ02_04705 [Clostridia bacterium]|nr:hypothetical protein [Clostridia bacterium]
MKRILPILLVIILVLLPCCSEKPDADFPGEDEIHTSQVVSRLTAEYGDHVYTEHDYELHRYNRKTGVMQTVCTDPNCGPDCFLCSPSREITQVVDGRLYGCYMLIRTREFAYAYWDIVTNEQKVLLTLPRSETPEMNPPVLNGRYLYYTGQYLREDGDAKNPDDYQPYVGRIPMDGGEPEVVCSRESNLLEHLLAVSDGKAITSLNACLYAIDFDTDERTLLFDPEEHGLSRRHEWYSYLDGKLYLLYHSPEFSEEKLAHEDISFTGRLYYSYLVRIDTQTGEMTRLPDKGVDKFWITEDTIYYTKQGFRVFYISPENFDENAPYESTVFAPSLETIYACDLDGSNRREVHTDPLMDIYTHDGTVIDDCYYGLIAFYDETQHKKVVSYGTLDFTTGEFTPAVIEE